MSPIPSIRPRHGRALAAILAVAAGGWLTALAAAGEPAAPKNPLGEPATPAATSTQAASSAQLTGNATNGNSTAQLSIGELRALEQFLNVPPERLAQLRKALEFIEKMSPSERAALQEHIKLRNDNIRQVRDAINPEVRQLAPPQRDLMAQYLQTLFPEDCQAYLRRIAATTTPEQRQTIVMEMLAKATALGIKPREQANPNRGNPGERGQAGARSGPVERGGQGANRGAPSGRGAQPNRRGMPAPISPPSIPQPRADGPGEMGV